MGVVKREGVMREVLWQSRELANKMATISLRLEVGADTRNERALLDQWLAAHEDVCAAHHALSKLADLLAACDGASVIRIVQKGE